jgi:hypothetical protein
VPPTASAIIDGKIVAQVFPFDVQRGFKQQRRHKDSQNQVAANVERQKVGHKRQRQPHQNQGNGVRETKAPDENGHQRRHRQQKHDADFLAKQFDFPGQKVAEVP